MQILLFFSFLFLFTSFFFLFLSKINTEKIAPKTININKMDEVYETVRQKMPDKTIAKYQQRIQWAGEPKGLTPEKFYTIKIFGFVVSIFLLLTIPINPLNPFILVLLSALFVIGPEAWLSGICKKRQRLIDESILDATELLSIPCNSGMTFSTAIKYLADKTDNIVIKELERSYTEIAAGKDARITFKDMAERNGAVNLGAFVRAIQHNQTLGVSISQFLAEESEKIRTLRKAKIQGAGQRVGTKVLIVGVLVMGPAFLILMFGPLLAHVGFRLILPPAL